ncbi:MAG: hypothetical protein Q7R67_00470 [bacterium]|nr:hypothetical protein [bacterium]
MKKKFYINILILGVFLVGSVILITRTSSNAAPEIEKIKNLTNAEAQGVELKKLLERVGPTEAQEQMLHSGLPFTGQTHLLIHVIGDYIYNQYGPEGLALCRDYFLSACYHGFIINTLGDHGMDGMQDAMERCNSAPLGVATQCAHAAGHGFTAWHDYDLLKGLSMCDELGERVVDFTYYNCYDGVFMENVWGVHNGTPSEKRWVKTDDIYYPCNDSRIPEKYLKGCWANQATLIYQHFKGDLKKTAEACDAVKNPSYQETCYNNFSRQIHPLTKGDKEKVFSLCANATGQKWQDECVLTNMVAYFSVGDRILPEQICNMARSELKDRCLERLDGMIKYYSGE